MIDHNYVGCRPWADERSIQDRVLGWIGQVTSVQDSPAVDPGLPRGAGFTIDQTSNVCQLRIDQMSIRDPCGFATEAATLHGRSVIDQRSIQDRSEEVDP